MNTCALLFWDVTAQKWTVNKNFSPNNGGGTFGSQWFLVPGECSFDGTNFTKKTVITGASIHGNFTGSLRAGKYTVEPGNISIENATITAALPCTLETEAVSNNPFLLCNGLTYPLVAVFKYRGARSG